MNLYDVNLHNYQGGIENHNAVVLAQSSIDAAIAVLTQLKDLEQMTPSMKALKNLPKSNFEAKSNFELRCFERSSPHVL
jgi:hypothetical protein